MSREGAASRGLPSMLWRSGQDRRLRLIEDHARLSGALALDIGCGLGLYTGRMAAGGAAAVGTEVEWDRLVAARGRGVPVVAAVAEALPFAAAAFDVVLLHEVLEHVADDRAAAREVIRVLRPGGRALVFVPNRWWPFETHGIRWRGRYRFGNIPGVNYLPDPLRNHLAGHVRVYTRGSLRALWAGLPVRVVHHTQIYPGYDTLATRRPWLGRWLRRLTYALERTRLRTFGLSHLLVVEVTGQLPQAAPD
jgi:SAM-dependent methyltransferase